MYLKVEAKMNFVGLLKTRSKSQWSWWKDNHRLLQSWIGTKQNNKEISNDWKRIKKISVVSSHLCLITKNTGDVHEGCVCGY